MNMRTHAEGKLELGRSLLRALSNTGISVLYQDLGLRVIWSQNLPAEWAVGDLLGKTDTEFLPKQEAERLLAAKRSLLDGGEAANLEIRIDTDDDSFWYEIWVDLDAAEDGRQLGIVTTIRDISEQKQREQTLRTLLREVSHRSKNLLAIIQSIATQTGRHASTIGNFMERFRGRIQSLAASQDLVTSSNWRGADLRELVAGQVARYVGDPARNIRVEGYNPYLNPNAALHIGLALHELAVNSVSFGALSRPEGQINIRADLVATKKGETELELVWTERVPMAPKSAIEKRFGTTALERVVPTSLNGSATLEIGDDTLTYRLHVPKGSFELD